MSHKFDHKKAHKLISPKRYQELKPDILLHKLGVPPGSTILDLGCGNGFFTFPAAMAMGEEGMVIAADVSKNMLSLLNRRMPPDNVQVLQVEEVEMNVDTASADAAVAIALYHEFRAPQKNLAEIKRVLKPEGRLMILDWDPNAKSDRGPGKEHRVLQKDADKDLRSAGFIIDVSETYTDDIWLIIAHLPA